MTVDLKSFARKHAFLFIAFAGAVTVLIAGWVPPRRISQITNPRLLLTLFSLLVTVEILKHSRLVEWIAGRVVAHSAGARSFVLAVVAFTGVLSALVTNDVALFVVIPFTVVACRLAKLSARNIVMLEVVAANLVGCLTPLGNPQNLFIFSRAGWSAETFVRIMLPFVLASGLGLLFAILALQRPAELERLELPSPVIDHVTALAGVGCFALILAQIFRLTTPLVPALITLAAGALVLRRKMLQVDYSIIPLFFFAFVAVDGLRAMNAYRLLAPFRIGDSPLALYVSAIGLSQIMSNVPATILLAPVVHTRWQVLLYGVNAGGCGTIIASLANLLGYQIFVNEEGEDEQFFWRFFVLNCAFLVWIGVIAWMLL